MTCITMLFSHKHSPFYLHMIYIKKPTISHLGEDSRTWWTRDLLKDTNSTPNITNFTPSIKLHLSYISDIFGGLLTVKLHPDRSRRNNMVNAVRYLAPESVIGGFPEERKQTAN